MSPKLLTVQDAAERLGANVRHLIFHDTDGFATRCVVRLGRAVRIREDALAAWIDERTGAPPFKFSADWRDRNAAGAAGRPPRKRAAAKGGR